MASAVAVNIYGVNKLLIWSHKTNVGWRFVHSVHWFFVTVSCVQILSLWAAENRSRTTLQNEIHHTHTHARMHKNVLHILFHRRALICLWPRFFWFYLYPKCDERVKRKERKRRKKEATDHFVESACYFVLTKTYLDCLLCSFLFVSSSNATVTLRRSCLEFRYLLSLHCRWLLNWYQFRWVDNVNEMKRRKYREKNDSEDSKSCWILCEKNLLVLIKCNLWLVKMWRFFSTNGTFIRVYWAFSPMNIKMIRFN